MPNKYPIRKGWDVPKQRYKVSNWPEYNKALRQRGSLEVWISQDAIDQWYEVERVYDGTGTPRKFSDFAVIICHEVRQVYRLPLRQCQGFIDSLFELAELKATCPDYSCLSKRLSALEIKSPRYKQTDKSDESVEAIAIDSTGLKRFGRDEWRQEKYQLSAKRSWRKLHIAVDDHHVIHAAILTDQFVADDQVVGDLIKQIEVTVDNVMADGAYDKNPVYQTLSDALPDANIIIPPDSDAVYNKQNHPERNRNFQEIKTFGRMNWQRARNYGKRNYSELCIERYKRILGNTLHARELSRQKNEAMMGCGVLNKMTGIGMPISFKIN